MSNHSNALALKSQVIPCDIVSDFRCHAVYQHSGKRSLRFITTREMSSPFEDNRRRIQLENVQVLREGRHLHAEGLQVFAARNGAARYLLVTQERAILFEMAGSEHLAKGLPTLDEVRSSTNVSFVATADRLASAERQWAREMGALISELVGRGARVGTERISPGIVNGLQAQGFELTDAQGVVERARAIKTPEELQCIRASLACTEAGVTALRSALRSGMSENQLWSVLHQAVLAGGGEYFETRLLNSGCRSNPWFKETGAKRIADNELVALDTDVVGCFGYYADFSRTFHTGPSAPSRRQRDLYQTALEQVSHNLSILRPGMSFRDYALEACPIPERYFANRYYVSANGVGIAAPRCFPTRSGRADGTPLACRPWYS